MLHTHTSHHMRHASPCIPMRPHVSPCVPMRPHASPCVPMRPHASPCVPACRVLLGSCVSLCLSPDRCRGQSFPASRMRPKDPWCQPQERGLSNGMDERFSLFSCRIHTISPCSRCLAVLQITVSCVNFKVRSRRILWVYRTVVVEVWYHSVHMTSHDNGVCCISGRCLFDHDQCAARPSPAPCRQRWMPCSWRDEMGIGTFCFNVVLPWHLQIFHFDKPPVSLKIKLFWSVLNGLVWLFAHSAGLRVLKYSSVPVPPETNELEAQIARSPITRSRMPNFQLRMRFNTTIAEYIRIA